MNHLQKHEIKVDYLLLQTKIGIPSYDTLLVLARLLLPSDLLNCFDIVKIEDINNMLTIHATGDGCQTRS